MLDFKALFEAAPALFLVVEADVPRYTIVAASDAFLDHTLTRRDEIVGKGLFEVFPDNPDDPATSRSLARVVAGRAPDRMPMQRHEVRRAPEDGGGVEERWWDPVNSPVFGPSGELAYIVHRVEDVTDFVRNRDELIGRLVAEAKFSGIVSIAADAIISIDDDHRITMFNDGAEKIFGYRRVEMLGEHVDVLLPERLRARHGAHIRAFAAGNESARRMGERASVIVGLRKNGDEFPADASISRLRIGGKVLLTISLRDVSERKLVEDQQRLLAETGNVLIAAGADWQHIVTDVAALVVRELADWCVVYLVQPDGISRIRVTHASPAKAALCKELQEYPLDGRRTPLTEALESQQSRLFSDVPAGFVESAAQSEAHLRLLRELDPRSMIIAPLVARGHSLGALVLGATRPLRFGPQEQALAERLATLMALAVDNARLYSALEQAVQTRDDVLAVVAHDLRSPLNTLMLEAEVVRNQPPHAVAQRALRFAERVTRSSQRMNRLIQDLLDAARSGQGGLTVSGRAIAPDSLLAEAVETHGVLAADRSIVLRLDVEKGLPRIWGDSHRLLQLIGNLVGNALKFTADGGAVTLGAVRKGDHVEFRVEDNGRGIPEALLPHVFERFWQAIPGDRRGAGLGLSIAKSIVEGHHGTISVESQPGAGATFRFTVPITPFVQTPDAERDHHARP